MTVDIILAITFLIVTMYIEGKLKNQKDSLLSALDVQEYLVNKVMYNNQKTKYIDTRLKIANERILLMEYKFMNDGPLPSRKKIDELLEELTEQAEELAEQKRVCNKLLAKIKND